MMLGAASFPINLTSLTILWPKTVISHWHYGRMRTRSTACYYYQWNWVLPWTSNKRWFQRAASWHIHFVEALLRQQATTYVGISSLLRSRTIPKFTREKSTGLYATICCFSLCSICAFVSIAISSWFYLRFTCNYSATIYAFLRFRNWSECIRA